VSRSIEVDDEVWAELQRLAVPLVDTPNTVLRRLLGLVPADANGTPVAIRSRRAQTGPHKDEYELPILQALAAAGGFAETRDVLDAIGEALGSRFTPHDIELSGNGNELRWEARAYDVRRRLIDRGLMHESRQRGIWHVTEEGKALAERNST
jgi:hypothetical protein